MTNIATSANKTNIREENIWINPSSKNNLFHECGIHRLTTIDGTWFHVIQMEHVVLLYLVLAGKLKFSLELTCNKDDASRKPHLSMRSPPSRNGTAASRGPRALWATQPSRPNYLPLILLLYLVFGPCNFCSLLLLTFCPKKPSFSVVGVSGHDHGGSEVSLSG